MLLYVNPLSAPQAIRAGSTVPDAGSPRERTALKELEHYFAFTLLQEMRKSVPKTGLMDGGQAQQMYEEMLDDALSGAMSESGQLGVSRMLEEQLRVAETAKRVRPSGSAPPVASVTALIPRSTELK